MDFVVFFAPPKGRAIFILALDLKRMFEKRLYLYSFCAINKKYY